MLFILQKQSFGDLVTQIELDPAIGVASGINWREPPTGSFRFFIMTAADPSLSHNLRPSMTGQALDLILFSIQRMDGLNSELDLLDPINFNTTRKKTITFGSIKIQNVYDITNFRSLISKWKFTKPINILEKQVIKYNYL